MPSNRPFVDTIMLDSAPETELQTEPEPETKEKRTLHMTRHPRTNSYRKVVAGIAAVALTGAGVALTVAPANATAGVAISGHVSADQTSGPAVPLTDGTAELFALTGQGGAAQEVATAPIADGTYHFGGVATGRYHIFFKAQDGNTGSGWLGSPYESSSTLVDVADSALTGLNDELPAGNSISGTVTASDSSLQTDVDSVEATAYLIDPATNLFDDQNSETVPVGSDGSYTITDVTPGTYIVRVAPEGQADLKTFAAGYVTSGDNDLYDAETTVVPDTGVPVSGVDINVDSRLYEGQTGYWSERLSGADRYETSSTISSDFFTGSGTNKAQTVFIASGENYPDALSASAAAAWGGGPLLLVPSTGLPTETKAELVRLNPVNVVVVGGTAAIGASVYNAIKTAVPQAHSYRVSGIDRYDTSRQIASDVFTSGGTQHIGTPPVGIDAVFVATGQNYPDALVSGGAAGYTGGPLVLVNGSATSLDATTTNLLTTLAPKRIYIVGGDSAVSAGIQADLDSIAGVPTVLRLSGADRFATAAAVNEKIFPFADTAYLATAYGFADALSISAVSGATASPLYLSQQDCIPDETWNSMTATVGASAIVLIGGTSALSNDVEDLTTCWDGEATKPITSSSAPLLAKPALPQLPLATPRFGK